MMNSKNFCRKTIVAVVFVGLGLFTTTAQSNGRITIDSNGSSVNVSGQATVNLGRVSVTLKHGRTRTTSSGLLLNTTGYGKDALTAADIAETAAVVDAQTLRLETLINNGAVRERRVDYLIKKQNKIISRFEAAQEDGVYTKNEHRKVAKLVRAQASRLDSY